MNNEELGEYWDSISEIIRRVIRSVQKLPTSEQDTEFSEWLDHALDHSEKRSEALIDPS